MFYNARDTIKRISRYAYKITYKLFGPIFGLLSRWTNHAAREFWGPAGYAGIGAIIAIYSFCYSLADEAYQRGELRTTLSLNTFVTLVSSDSRPSFIAAIKGFGEVQDALGYEAPSFWYLTTWFQPTTPNKVFLKDWAKAIFQECTNETCGNKDFRIDVRNARWNNTELWSVDLNHADFSNGAMSYVMLGDLNLSKANLTNISMWESKIFVPDFRDAIMRCGQIVLTKIITFLGDDSWPAHKSRFDRADMQGISINQSNIGNATFDDANFSETSCSSGSSHRRSEIKNSDARKASFRRAILRKVSFVDTNLQEANLEDSILEEADLRGTDLRGANLTGAKLNGAFYSLSTRWPEGFDASLHGARFVEDRRY